MCAHFSKFFFNAKLQITKFLSKDVLLWLFGHLYGMAGWTEEEANGGGGPIVQTGVVVTRPTEDAFLSLIHI